MNRNNLQRGEGDAEKRARTQRWEDEERRRLEAKEERLHRDQEKYEREKQSKSSAVSSRYVDDFMPAHLRHHHLCLTPVQHLHALWRLPPTAQHLVEDEAMEDDDIDDEDV